MRSSHRSDIPDPHAAAGVVLWIVASAVVVAGALVVVGYLVLGRSDTSLGGWLSQLVSGTKSVSSALPAPDQVGASILRSVVTTVIVAFVAVIGGIGIWDAWQSRHGRSERELQRGGQEASDALSTANPEYGSFDLQPGPPGDAETYYSPDVAQARTRRNHPMSTGPDTWQGGTA
jgi:hypothetical protein